MAKLSKLNIRCTTNLIFYIPYSLSVSHKIKMSHDSNFSLSQIYCPSNYFSLHFFFQLILYSLFYFINSVFLLTFLFNHFLLLFFILSIPFFSSLSSNQYLFPRIPTQIITQIINRYCGDFICHICFY